MRESKKEDLWQKTFSFLINSRENHTEKSQLFHTTESKTVFTTTAIKTHDFAIIKLPDQEPPDLKNQYHELCKSSSLLWWKRFFDIGYYLGQVPYRIVPKDHNSYEFTLVETRLNQVISLICQILTLLGSWNILARLTSSDKPRIPNLLSWVSDFGTFCIQLSIYYTIWFKKAEIVHLLNTYLLSWKCWQEEKRSRYYCKQKKNKTNHVRLTTCYCLFFGALCLSYFYELGRDTGWSLKAVFFRSCAQNSIFSSNSCSKDTIFWQDIPFTAVKFSAWKLTQIMAILCDMFFLSSCVFYGRFNDEIGQFPEEDDYKTAEKNYSRLRNLNRALNDAAGFAVLMIVVGGLPFYVGHMPEIVTTYINNSLNSSQYRVFIFLTYYFGIFFWTSLKLSNVEYRLKLWAERLDMVSTQMTIPFRYHVFHLDIQTNTNLEFAPCGIFKFNYDFCKALLSFAATYSIILVQMGQSSSGNVNG